MNYGWPANNARILHSMIDCASNRNHNLVIFNWIHIIGANFTNWCGFLRWVLRLFLLWLQENDYVCNSQLLSREENSTGKFCRKELRWMHTNRISILLEYWSRNLSIINVTLLTSRQIKFCWLQLRDFCHYRIIPFRRVLVVEDRWAKWRFVMRIKFRSFFA